MRPLTACVLVACGLLLAATDARAAGYATDDRGNLYRVFPSTKEVEKMGTVQVPGAPGATPETPQLTDIALHDEHGMFGISYSHLYKINLREPSKSSRVGALGGNFFSTFNALEFDEEGNLYMAGSGTLYRVDLKTGKAKRIGDFGTTWTSDGDLAWIEDTLYATVRGPKGCILATIDVKTGKAKSVGYIRIARKDRKKILYDVWGLIWDGRVLWALTQHGQLIKLDRDTAVAKAITLYKVTFWGACGMLRI